MSTPKLSTFEAARRVFQQATTNNDSNKKVVKEKQDIFGIENF